jgi:hypothetical protein
MSEASGHLGLWTEPKYPGDAVRELVLQRNGLFGSIAIRQYGPQSVLVGSYLPGVTECPPGDTPKTRPEKHKWARSSYMADEVFDQYVQEAYADLWQNYYPEGQ